MRKLTRMGVVALLVLGFCAWTQAGAQSLGEAARKARAEKQNNPKKATRTYSNENMPTSGAISTVGAAAAPAKEAGKEAQPKEESKKDLAEQEKEWRAKFAKLRESLKYEEKKLDVLQRELNLSQIQNYSDPNVAMREQNQRTEINSKTQEIEAQKKAIDKIKADISSLEDDLRRKNLPARWSEGQ